MGRRGRQQSSLTETAQRYIGDFLRPTVLPFLTKCSYMVSFIGMITSDPHTARIVQTCLVPVGARCSSVVRWVVGPILHGRPIELFIVPASDPRLV